MSLKDTDVPAKSSEDGNGADVDRKGGRVCIKSPLDLQNFIGVYSLVRIGSFSFYPLPHDHALR